MFSNFLQLNHRDLVKSVVVYFISTFITALYTILEAGELPSWEQWQKIAIVSAGATLSYLVKNLFTNSEDKFAKHEESL